MGNLIQYKACAAASISVKISMVGSFYHNTLATITKYISYDTFKNSKNPYSSLQSLPLKTLKCIPPRKSSPKDKQEKNNRN